MWAKNERGAASMEYVAMLLVAALFAGAVAVSIKPEWVRYKVCQALVAISGEGSCSAPARPPAQTPPKVCTINSSTDSTTIHGGVKAAWFKADLEAGYGYRYIELSDDTVNVELYYDVKGDAGASAGLGGNGKVGADISVTGSGKHQKGEIFHYDSLSAAQADQSRLKQYAEDKALSNFNIGSEPKLEGARPTATSKVEEYALGGEAGGGFNPGGSAHKSTVAGLEGKSDGKVLFTRTVNQQTRSVTTKIETVGALKGTATVNTPGSGPHLSANANGQKDGKTSVSVTEDKSGKITELVITQSEAGGSGFGLEVGEGSTGKGKYKPKHSAGKAAKGSSDPDYKPRHAADNKRPDPKAALKSGTNGMDRTTKTYRLAVNDSNRAEVTKWLGGNGISRYPWEAGRLLWKAASINPVDAHPSDDFAKFLHDSEDAQIDFQTTTESSSSGDHSLKLIIGSGGGRDDTTSSSSTGQTYYSLESGQRVSHPVVGCK